MFEKITGKVLQKMQELERLDVQDREDGTPRMERLRQIPPETGRFIALLAASAPEGEFLEIGTSAGYSTLWLSLAARERGIKIKTFELLEEKLRMARETFDQAESWDAVELVPGDALDHLGALEDISFCFLDAEKEIYDACWDILAEKMVPGVILVAYNAINHQATLRPMLDKALQDPRFDAMIVPIGKGELVCRRKFN